MEEFVLKYRRFVVLYGFIRYYAQRQGLMNGDTAVVVIKATDTGRVLCVHPTAETYLAAKKGQDAMVHVVGGGIEDGQPPLEAALAELEQEIGVKVNRDLLRELGETTVIRGKLKNRTFVFLWEVAAEADLKFLRPDNHEFCRDHNWYNPEEAARLSTEWLRQALAVAKLVQ